MIKIVKFGKIYENKKGQIVFSRFTFWNDGKPTKSHHVSKMVFDYINEKIKKGEKND